MILITPGDDPLDELVFVNAIGGMSRCGNSVDADLALEALSAGQFVAAVIIGVGRGFAAHEEALRRRGVVAEGP